MGSNTEEIPAFSLQTAVRVIIVCVTVMVVGTALLRIQQTTVLDQTMVGLNRIADNVNSVDKHTLETVVFNIPMAVTSLTVTATVTEVGLAREAEHKTFAEKCMMCH
ncbi:Hypothetical predicted protein [Mytilus galloprovincialis]|uniref:Uncharacterized protein n=1 Tax=Mytilus galloprovincialis TaxID=29158 RepID=A0A8B6FSM6_MYTGA|nr:Hypothetical predicted protein [Mytilus galloprovincialis]